MLVETELVVDNVGSSMVMTTELAESFIVGALCYIVSAGVFGSIFVVVAIDNRPDSKREKKPVKIFGPYGVVSAGKLLEGPLFVLI